MSQFYTCHLPSIELWAYRIWSNPVTVQLLRHDPTFFSYWSLLLEGTDVWSDEVQAVLDEANQRELSFEEAAKALEHANLSTGKPVSLELSKRLIAAYEVWKFYKQHPDSVIARVDLVASKAKAQAYRKPSRVGALARALELTPLESDLLAFSLVSKAFEPLFRLVQVAQAHGPEVARHFWMAVFDAKEDSFGKALTDSVLQTTGMLRISMERAPVLSDYWVSQLLMSETGPLLGSLVQPFSVQAGAALPARLSSEDAELLQKLLRAPVEPGVNLMLYGAESMEYKTAFAQALTGANRKAVVLARHPELDDRDYPSLVFAVQRLLAQDDPQAVLVLEKAHEALARRYSSSFMQAFGFREVSDDGLSAQDELLLKKNPVTTVWTGARVKTLPEECLAQFVFHAPLRKAKRSERRAQLEVSLDELKLSPDTKAELLGLEEVSAQQLESALRAAKLSGAKSSAQKERVLVQAVKRSLKALNRATSANAKECVTAYSLEYLNHRGRFGPQEILKAFKRKPKGTLCLYGAPGTGKTQFVEYLAQQLGMPLLMKRASDLMSKWVGENEKNIALAFEEAENQEAILFLDEGDSFLKDRNNAQAGWEVTQVNELLQHMERFPGIFIVATNLFNGLDAAALRRFTFKMELLELDADQRWRMFLTESGLNKRKTPLPEAERESMYETLCMMPKLASGDFATVKRQADLMSVKLSPKQWLEQLALECELKVAPRVARGGVRMD